MPATYTLRLLESLLDCPFCGSKADAKELLTGFSGSSTIYCSNKRCDASAPYKDNRDGSPIWNARATDKKLADAKYEAKRADEDKESMATSLIELHRKYVKLEKELELLKSPRNDKLVFKCEKFELYADENGLMVKTKDRTKWSRLEHFLNYDLELEAENEDLKSHVRKWEDFYQEIEKSVVIV